MSRGHAARNSPLIAPAVRRCLRAPDQRRRLHVNRSRMETMRQHSSAGRRLYPVLGRRQVSSTSERLRRLIRYYRSPNIPGRRRPFRDDPRPRPFRKRLPHRHPARPHHRLPLRSAPRRSRHPGTPPLAPMANPLFGRLGKRHLPLSRDRPARRGIPLPDRQRMGLRLGARVDAQRVIQGDRDGEFERGDKGEVYARTARGTKGGYRGERCGVVSYVGPLVEDGRMHFRGSPRPLGGSTTTRSLVHKREEPCIR